MAPELVSIIDRGLWLVAQASATARLQLRVDREASTDMPRGDLGIHAPAYLLEAALHASIYPCAAGSEAS